MKWGLSGLGQPCGLLLRRVADSLFKAGTWSVWHGSAPDARDLWRRLESEVRGPVWSAGSAMSVRQVVDALNEGRPEPLANTMVMTVMDRLADKQTLTCGPANQMDTANHSFATLAVSSVLLGLYVFRRAAGCVLVPRIVSRVRSWDRRSGGRESQPADGWLVRPAIPSGRRVRACT